MAKSKKTLSQMKPKRLRKLAIAAGADPDRARIMAEPGVDPDLRLMWLRSLAPADARTLTLDADVAERVVIMARDDVDPDLRALFLAQMVSPEPAPATRSAPLGMDDQRYELHQQAKQLADARCLAEPRLDPGETYALAAVEIVERQHPGVI